MDNMTFGDKLKAIRNEKKMSQDELADLLRTSKQVISRYETNQRTPKITVASSYAVALGVPLNYLLDNSVDSIEQARYNSSQSLDAQLSSVDFALWGEVKALSDGQKKDVLAYIKFRKQQGKD